MAAPSTFSVQEKFNSSLTAETRMFAYRLETLGSRSQRSAAIRLWWLYWLAWLPFYGVVVLATRPSLGWLRFSVVPLYNVLPAALLGVMLIRRTRRRALDEKSFSLALELLVVLALAATATAASYGLFATHRFIAEGVFAPYTFRPIGVAWRLLDRFLIYALLAALVHTHQVSHRLREEENRALRAVALRREVELKALWAQLNPHFLFNSLQSLIALSRREPEKVERGLTQMGDLLRYSLRAQARVAEEVTLAHELTIVESYLSLERMRLGERLRLSMDIEPEARECRLPAFSLQPLVENAIRHSIAPRKKGGRLSITARLRNKLLVVGVHDDGPGALAVDVEGTDKLGLRLIRERLRVLYGEGAELVVETDWQEGFTAWLTVPAEANRIELGAVSA